MRKQGRLAIPIKDNSIRSCFQNTRASSCLMLSKLLFSAKLMSCSVSLFLVWEIQNKLGRSSLKSKCENYILTQLTPAFFLVRLVKPVQPKVLWKMKENILNMFSLASHWCKRLWEMEGSSGLGLSCPDFPLRKQPSSQPVPDQFHHWSENQR